VAFWVIAACALLAGAIAWQLARQSPRVTLAGTIGLCAPALTVAHPRACARLARAPRLFLSGPADDAGNAAGTRVIVAGASRRFSVRVRTGRYALCLELADGLLLAPRGLPRCAITIDGPRAGLAVVPGSAWRVARDVAPS
jgi:hypothetical protein